MNKLPDVVGPVDMEVPLAIQDPVNPDHYKQGSVEAIEVTENFSFSAGNAIKYIWRHQHKGNPIQDLKKAAWYIEREIKRLGGDDE